MVKLTLTNKKANTAIKFRKLCFKVLDDHGKSYIFYLLYDLQHLINKEKEKRRLRFSSSI